MTNLLILYPEGFASLSKFERKLSKITSRFDTFSIIHQGDPHAFINTLFANDKRVSSINQTSTLQETDISHAVVIDDGEEFTQQHAWLVEQSIPTRWIKVPITRVINIKRETCYTRNTTTYEYIGRGSYWGNPHAMFEQGESREEVIRQYEYDFTYDKFINIDPTRVHELTGKRLGCHCKPAACHGDILANYLNQYDDGK
jgi:hypothetical protein